MKQKRISKRLLASTTALCLSFGTITFGQERGYQEQGYEIQYIVEDGNLIIDGDAGPIDLYRYALINKMGIGLTIEDRIAYIYAECKTYEYADISMTVELQRFDGYWKTIKTYDAADTDSKICSVDKSYAVTRNYDYRVKLSVSVTVDSDTEEDTKYGTVQTCY